MNEPENFSALMGRRFLLNQLMRPVTSGRVNHAQIFEGPRGTGKSSAAHLVAKAVNCTGTGNRPCGVCPSCLRYKEGSPLGLTEVFPDGKSVKIEQIRAVTDDILIKPESGMKCVIIHEADRMTEAAQNSLLKTLEEPPEYALFMLLTESSAALLPTIRSRCVLIRFAPLEHEGVRQLLESRGIDADIALEAARNSGGSPGRALEIAEDKNYRTLADSVVNAFDGIKTQKDVSMKCGMFKGFADKKDTFLEMCELAASEMMMVQNTGGTAAGRLARTLIMNGIDGARLMKAVLRCRERLDSNITFHYAVEMLLFDITSMEDK